MLILHVLLLFQVWKVGTLELVHSISDLKHWVRALAFDKTKVILVLQASSYFELHFATKLGSQEAKCLWPLVLFGV